MRHRANHRSTHLMTVESRVQTGTDAQDEPLYDRQEVVSGEPVRFSPANTEYTREDGGERVRRSPTLRGRPYLVDDVSEGDTITLVPKGPSDTDGAKFEASSVDGVYGVRTSSKLIATKIQLEAIG